VEVLSTYSGVRVAVIVLATWVAACAEPATSEPVPIRSASKRLVAERLLPTLTAQGGLRAIVKLETPYEVEPKLTPDQRLLQRRAIATAQNVATARLARHGITRASVFETVPYMVVDVPSAAALDVLVADDEIRWIEPDDLHPPALATTKTLVGATTAHNAGFTGAGYAVAVLDTGVMKTHSYLAGRVVAEACYSTTNATYSATSVCPGGATASTATGSGVNCASSDAAGCFHGTFVAGIAASGHATNTGMAKGANVIAMQVFSKFTSTTYCGGSSPCVLAFTSDWAQGLERVYALAQAGTPIAAVNLSLGGGMYSSTCDAGNNESIIKTYVAALRSAGIATVAANGNDGYTSAIASPACISNIISVGATTKADGIASYSNNASITTLYAPGSSITSATITSTTATATADGTSGAAPHVAGAFAVMRSAKNDMTVDEGVAALVATGTAVSDTRTGTAITKPRINIGSAVAALTPTAPAFSLATGTYTTAQSLTLTSATTGTTIRYTTNNTAVTASSTLYTGAITVPLDATTVVRAKSFKAGLTDSAEVTATYVVTSTVATPTFSVAAGTYTTAQTVTIGSATSGATIRCTTDGSTPTAASATCTSVTVPLDTTLTLQARAFKAGSTDSAVAVATYVVTGTVALPAVSIPAGTYTSAQTVTLLSSTPGASVRCTTDGSTPTSASAVCTTVTIPLDTTRTIKAIATRATWADSPALTAVYVVTGTASAPTFSVATGTYPTAQTVTLGSATSGATVRCTMDGSTPTSASPTCTTITIPLETTRTIRAIATKTNWLDSTVASATYVITGTVAPPTITPGSGPLAIGATVTLATTTAGATIRYTLDGSTPTAASTAYSAPLALPQGTTTTVRAFATKPDWSNSAVAAATYDAAGTVATPTLSPAPGTFTAPVAVTIATTTPTATIRYTLDGTEPTAGSPLYTGAITVGAEQSAQLRARAFRSQWNDSAVAAGTYTVTCAHVAPTVSLAPSIATLDPGALGSFAVAITNRDPSGCKPQAFSLVRSVPTGWSSTLAATAITIAPGAVQTVTLDVRPPLSALAGTFSISATATAAAGDSGSGTASVHIRCTPGAPTLTLAPPAQNSAVGTLVTYTATVGNTDLGCAASTFSTIASGPVGWTVVASAPTTTVAAGASASFTIDVTSPMTASGTASIMAMAARPSTTLSAVATYTVVPCERRPPTLVLASTSITALRGASASYAGTLTNHDVACGATAFTVTPTVPGGWVAAPVVVTVASGASASVDIAVRSSATAPADTYPVDLEVMTASHSRVSTPADFTVLPACERAAPTLVITEPAATTTPSTQRYAIAVTNHDHVDCGATTFTVAASAPVGWTSSPPSSAIAPGAAATLELALTPPATLVESSTAVPVTLSGGPSDVSAEVHYVLGCAPTAPVVAIQALGDRRYAIAITSQDLASCAIATYSLGVSAPIAITPASAQLAVAPGATTTTEVEVAADAPAGSHTATVTVVRDAATRATQTFTVTIEGETTDPGDDTEGGGCASSQPGGLGLVLALGLLVGRRRCSTRHGRSAT